MGAGTCLVELQAGCRTKSPSTMDRSAGDALRDVSTTCDSLCPWEEDAYERCRYRQREECERGRRGRHRGRRRGRSVRPARTLSLAGIVARRWLRRGSLERRPVCRFTRTIASAGFLRRVPRQPLRPSQAGWGGSPHPGFRFRAPHSGARTGDATLGRRHPARRKCRSCWSVPRQVGYLRVLWCAGPSGCADRAVPRGSGPRQRCRVSARRETGRRLGFAGRRRRIQRGGAAPVPLAGKAWSCSLIVSPLRGERRGERSPATMSSPPGGLARRRRSRSKSCPTTKAITSGHSPAGMSSSTASRRESSPGRAPRWRMWRARWSDSSCRRAQGHPLADVLRCGQ